MGKPLPRKKERENKGRGEAVRPLHRYRKKPTSRKPHHVFTDQGEKRSRKP